MIRNPEISWQALADFCLAMQRMQEAGVDLRKSLASASRNSVDSRLPSAVGEIRQAVARGDSLTDGFGRVANRFPALFRDLVHVGEETGHLPEVFGSLARYYEARVAQQREFRSAMAWPLFNLFGAIGIVTFLIWILGILPSSGGQPLDILGLGLTGTAGAMTWLSGWILFLGGLVAGWKILNRNVAGQAFFHPFLLGIPGIGGCMRAFAIARFSWCFALTQKAGMSLRPSLKCSLRATGNGAFDMSEPTIWNELNEGESFADALAVSKLFPQQYLHFVETAEQSGTVPEQLDRLSHIFEDDAMRALKRLNRIFSTVIWIGIAIMIIVLIFRIVLTVYINPLYQQLDETMRL
ncbi:MAG: type II secretion system F family protein [Planctomycetaceae bacterium]|nr:type II secretion system F family protein [Planctomycetaceae bacterium]